MIKSLVRILSMTLGLSLLAGCGAQPKHLNIRTDQISSVEFVGGPVGASVLVDGVEVWQLQGNGKDKLNLDDGEHAVSVVFNGRELYSRAVFIQDGTKKRIILSK